jgi:peptide methionine sulfoxide reductase msrA/msrB
MNNKIKMKNILILLSVVLGIAVLRQAVEMPAKIHRKKKENETIMDNKNVKEVYFAGGCFWGTEHFFQQIRGVVGTEVGYANGNKKILHMKKW